jgi:ribosomal protein S3
MGQKTNSCLFRLGLKNSEWKYKYIEKNIEESSLIVFKNNEIKNYVSNIFKFYGVLIHNCKIEYSHNSVNLIISYYESQIDLKNNSLKKKTNSSKQTVLFLIKNVLSISLNLYLKNKTINIKTHNVNKEFEYKIKNNKQYFFEYKKNLKYFRRFLKNPIEKDLLKTLFISVYEHNSSKLIADSISFNLSKTKKRHNYLLSMLKVVLEKLIGLNFSRIQGLKIVIKGRFNGAPRAKKKLIQLGSLPMQSFNSSIDFSDSTSYTTNGTFGVKVWICEK